MRIPDDVSFEQACFVEPVNTCMKGIERLGLAAGRDRSSDRAGSNRDHLGGPGQTGRLPGNNFRFVSREAYNIYKLGLVNSIDASRTDTVGAVREMTEGRGADAVILAVGGNGLIRTAMDAARPGGRVLLFAQTVRGEAAIDPGSGLRG